MKSSLDLYLELKGRITKIMLITTGLALTSILLIACLQLYFMYTYAQMLAVENKISVRQFLSYFSISGFSYSVKLVLSILLLVGTLVATSMSRGAVSRGEIYTLQRLYLIGPILTACALILQTLALLDVGNIVNDIVVLILVTVPTGVTCTLLIMCVLSCLMCRHLISLRRPIVRK